MTAKTPLLSKTTFLAEIEDPNAGTGTFVVRDEETDAILKRISLRDDTWAELGSPWEITVTIEPGDRLNDENTKAMWKAEFEAVGTTAGTANEVDPTVMRHGPAGA